MKSPNSIPHRTPAFLLCALLALAVAACDGSSSSYRSPVAPDVPAFPTVTQSEALTVGTYVRVAPQSPGTLDYHGGSLTERYLFEENGAFRLQYQSARYGFFEYLGSYSTQGYSYRFDFEGWSTAGPWVAMATFRGQCVTVEYNVVMELSDFESGEYCR